LGKTRWVVERTFAWLHQFKRLRTRYAVLGLVMGRGTWSWIVPDGLWEIAEPLIPPSKVRPQGGGTQDTPDETLRRLTAGS
jgi:transposase